MKKLNPNIRLLLIAVLLIACNAIASVYFFRIDLTAEKRYTLSKPVKTLLRELPEPVTVDVLMGGELPSGFKRLAGTVGDLLSEAQDIAGINLRYNFVSPDEAYPGSDRTYADTIVSAGYYPINLTSQIEAGQTQQYVFPFAIIRTNDRAVPVELYKGRTRAISFSELGSAEALLEYKLAEGLAKVSQKEKPIVGYAIGNGEPTDGRVYDLSQNVLSPDYRFFRFDLNGPALVPKEMKALVVVKPTIGFSEFAKLKLDQYVLQGGRLLILADRLNAELDSLQIKDRVIAFDRDLGLNDLLFTYGARVNADLVMDLEADFLPFDVNGDGQFEFIRWNYFPILESRDNHPINKGLGFVAGKFLNSVDTVGAAGIKKTVLLSSSLYARKIGSPAIISPSEIATSPQDEKFRTPNIAAAVVLEGKFRSMYANRLTNALRDSLAQFNTNFLSAAAASSKVIVAGDGDIALNGSSQDQPIPMGMNPYTYGQQNELPFANADFVRNCLAYLTDERDLSESKAKEFIPRLINSKKAKEEKSFWQMINLGLPVIIVIIFAFIFQFVRERKYAVTHE